MKLSTLFNINLILVFLILFSTNGHTQNTNVYIYPKIKRFLGTESTLDRSVFFNIHSSGNDVDQAFYNDYNVLQEGGALLGARAFAVQQTDQ